MSLKFATTRSQVAHYDLAAAEEGLIESIEEVSAAAEALYDAGAEGAEICQVMDNIALAVEAIDNGGLTPEFLATFNSEGECLDCAGVESLTVEGLEAMGVSQVKKFEDKLAAGLEGKLGEYWAKFVAWLKNMWAKLVNWFKSILVNRSRYFKAIKAVLQDNNKKWEDKECKCVEAGEVEKAETAITDAEAYLVTNLPKVTTDAGAGELKVDDKIQALDKIGEAKAESKKLSERGWTEAKAKELAGRLAKISVSNEIKKLSATIDASFKGLINKAGAAGKLDDADKAKDAKEKVQKARENLMKCVDLLRNDNRAVMKASGAVLKVLKTGYKAVK